jgi:signal peptidase I
MKLASKHLTVALLCATGLVFSSCSVVQNISDFQATHFSVSSETMAPTLKTGDEVTVQLVSHPLLLLSRGRIVVLHAPATYDCAGTKPKFMIERVIGLPGETISLEDGHVLINAKPLREPWLPSDKRATTYPSPTKASSSLSTPFAIPKDDYFLMADNRTYSCDSRYWGPAGQSLIYGVARG